MSTGSPSFTIVMPVYERVAGFDEALDSARAIQGCTEILVIDDCSSHDGFERICSSVADPRLRYVRNGANLGIFGNWNHGVSEARGDFVSILCSDDLVAANAHDLLLSSLVQDPELDLVFGPFCTFRETASDATVVRRFAPGPVDPAEFLSEVAHSGPGFPVLTIGRRSSMAARPFVAAPHSGNDWWWIYSHASDLRMVATQEPFSFWRRHPDQDASRRQSITTDCWPLMYVSISHQLHRLGRHADARRSTRRAVGLILSWILNDVSGSGGYRSRLTAVGVEQNLFLAHASTVIQSNRVLQGLLHEPAARGPYRLLARSLRRSGWYPGG